MKNSFKVASIFDVEHESLFRVFIQILKDPFNEDKNEEGICILSPEMRPLELTLVINFCASFFFLKNFNIIVYIYVFLIMGRRGLVYVSSVWIEIIYTPLCRPLFDFSFSDLLASLNLTLDLYFSRYIILKFLF